MVASADPMVSVCMITYNHEPYIKKAIEGVLMQRCGFTFKLVIGEDFSSDATRLICQEYSERHPEIIMLLPSETNHGMMRNFIRTLDCCTGKYIAVCEGDDYWTDPLKLQKQVEFLETNPDYSLVYTNYRIHFEGSKHLDLIANPPQHKGNVLKDLIKRNFISTLTVIFRTSLLSKIDLNFDNFIIGDYPLWLQIAAISKIHYLDVVTSTYRVRTGSVSHSSSFEEVEKFQLSILQIQTHYLKKLNITDIKNEEIKYKSYYNIMNIAFNMNIYLKAKAYSDELPKNSPKIILKYLITRSIVTFYFYCWGIKKKNSILNNIQIAFRRLHSRH